LRGKTALAVLCAGMLAVTGIAHASDNVWIKAMNISPQIASDNDRYVAFQGRDKVPFVIDTWTGENQRIADARFCHPRQIGSGRVLMICPHRPRSKGDTGFRARVAYVNGGGSIPLKNSEKIWDAYEIGDYWVGIASNGYPGGPAYTKFLNWRSGEIKKVKSRNFPSGVDLDSPEISPGDMATFTPAFKGLPNPFFGRPLLCRGESVVLVDWKRQFRLWTDENHSVKLGRGDVFGAEQRCQWWQSIRIGDDWVTWSKRHTVHAYNYRTGQRFNRTYRFPAKITPIRDGVVVAVKTKKFGEYFKGFRVRVIRLGGGRS